MIFALDYDGTYNKAPELWDQFVANAKAAGHDVYCVTMRYPEERITMPCEVIYTSRKAKAKVIGERGIPVNVWIDDMPLSIFQGAE